MDPMGDVVSFGEWWWGFTPEAAGSFFEVTHSEEEEIWWTIKRQGCVCVVCLVLFASFLR